MKKEIGSFIGLDIRESGEYYIGRINIARLNSARAGIYHACKLLNCCAIQIPYYLCPVVKKFLIQKNIEVKPYLINQGLEPSNIRQLRDHAILIVNYFGLHSVEKVRMLASKFKNVIVDNSAAFYSPPLENCYNIYSPRKFFGVPDGCYVIGENASRFIKAYDQDYSSTTASFLMKIIEFGTSATYDERMRNEERIDKSDILRMSKLTRSMLKNIDYENIKAKRRENFYYMHNLFKDMNLLNPIQFIDTHSVPMIYPFLIDDIEIANKLRKEKVYIGRLWNHVLSEVSDHSFEAYLSKYLIPVPIDQRYSAKQLNYFHKLFCKLHSS